MDNLSLIEDYFQSYKNNLTTFIPEDIITVDLSLLQQLELLNEDDYLPILQRLSCVPLRRVIDMEHDTVFRSAFIVESVQVKISAKSQKKFAILMISDGIERAELPVWADLYEEKSHLLMENQMLYAVLQIDKKDEGMSFSCRWLDDLTRADEGMIEACDRAYDKAKQQAVRFAQSKNSAKKTPEKKEEKKGENKTQLLSIKMNIDQTRLSHIVQLKKLFTEHRGDVPVKIDFQSEGSSVAQMEIDSRWGINVGRDIQNQLKRISAVLSLDLK